MSPHPGQEPEKRARVLGVTVPPVANNDLVGGVVNSVAAEAGRSRVTVSLLLIVGLAAGAFYAGRSSPPPAMVAEQATQNERISKSLADLADSQKQTVELLRDISKSQATQLELARTTNTNLEFVSSYYKSGNPRP